MGDMTWNGGSGMKRKISQLEWELPGLQSMNWPLYSLTSETTPHLINVWVTKSMMTPWAREARRTRFLSRLGARFLSIKRLKEINVALRWRKWDHLYHENPTLSPFLLHFFTEFSSTDPILHFRSLGFALWKISRRYLPRMLTNNTWTVMDHTLRFC